MSILKRVVTGLLNHELIGMFSIGGSSPAGGLQSDNWTLMYLWFQNDLVNLGSKRITFRLLHRSSCFGSQGLLKRNRPQCDSNPYNIHDTRYGYIHPYMNG